MNINVNTDFTLRLADKRQFTSNIRPAGGNGLKVFVIAKKCQVYLKSCRCVKYHISATHIDLLSFLNRNQIYTFLNCDCVFLGFGDLVPRKSKIIVHN